MNTNNIALEIAVVISLLTLAIMLKVGPTPRFFGTMLWVHTWGRPKWMIFELMLRIGGTIVEGIHVWNWIYFPGFGFIRTIVEANTQTGEVIEHHLM